MKCNIQTKNTNPFSDTTEFKNLKTACYKIKQFKFTAEGKSKVKLSLEI